MNPSQIWRGTQDPSQHFWLPWLVSSHWHTICIWLAPACVPDGLRYDSQVVSREILVPRTKNFVLFNDPIQNYQLATTILPNRNCVTLIWSSTPPIGSQTWMPIMFLSKMCCESNNQMCGLSPLQKMSNVRPQCWNDILLAWALSSLAPLARLMLRPC